MRRYHSRSCLYPLLFRNREREYYLPPLTPSVQNSPTWTWSHPSSPLLGMKRSFSESPVIPYSPASPLLLRQQSYDQMSSADRGDISSELCSPLSFTSHTSLPLESCSPSPHLSQSLLMAEPSRSRRVKIPKRTRMLRIIKELQELKLNTVDLLLEIIGGKDDFEGYRNALFSPKNRTSLLLLLNTLLGDEKGQPIVTTWMGLHATQIVCDKIHNEMDSAKPRLRMNTTEVTPEFLAQWDINNVMESVAGLTPTWCAVLEAASETKCDQTKVKTPRSRNRVTVCPLLL